MKTCISKVISAIIFFGKRVVNTFVKSKSKISLTDVTGDGQKDVVITNDVTWIPEDSQTDPLETCTNNNEEEEV